MKSHPPPSSEPAQIQHNSQHPQHEVATPQLPDLAATGSAAGSGAAQSSSPFTYSNGNQTPAGPRSPIPPLIPLGSMARAPSGDIQSQPKAVSAGSSGTVAGTMSTQGRTQTSPSAVPMPARQLPLPRPQSRPQHGPVNAGPTLHPARGSQVCDTSPPLHETIPFSLDDRGKGHKAILVPQSSLVVMEAVARDDICLKPQFQG